MLIKNNINKTVFVAMRFHPLHTVKYTRSNNWLLLLFLPSMFVIQIRRTN